MTNAKHAVYTLKISELNDDNNMIVIADRNSARYGIFNLTQMFTEVMP